MMRIDIDEAEMVRLFLAGTNQRQLAERYGCSQSLIQRRIHAHRIEGWPTQAKRPTGTVSVNADPDAPWQSRAVCNDHESELFYHDMTVMQAKAICDGCEFRTACLEDALSRRDNHGVRGGMSGEERRRLLARRDKKAAA